MKLSKKLIKNVINYHFHSYKIKQVDYVNIEQKTNWFTTYFYDDDDKYRCATFRLNIFRKYVFEYKIKKLLNNVKK